MIEIPKSYNYCSAFLTFACNFRCSYCINKYRDLYKYTQLSGKDWIRGLNRIKTHADLPITISGGEPTLHPEFFDIINGVDAPMDLLTNGKFDIVEFVKNIDPDKLKRYAKYASIRFSYHPQQTSVVRLLTTVWGLQQMDYSVGIWAVDTGEKKIKHVQRLAKSLGIDFRLKDFLDETHGNYVYPEGLDGKPKSCLCKPSELLIAPDGRLFKCHSDLYAGVNSYGHILETEYLPTDFYECDRYGFCNPCDLKAKFDRFQELGHCSVTIKESNEA